MALYTYPSNKLEYLVEIFAKLLRYNQENKNIFDKNNILVGSRGMQHWLSMELADKNSITMNYNFDMVNSFIVNTCSTIATTENSKQAYAKDVLTWRIYKIISSTEFIAKSINTSLNNYWVNKECKSTLKCYQLSNKISEVFSKYIKYRPQWLCAWQENKNITIDNNDILKEDELWQMNLWQELVNQEPHTPISTQKRALSHLQNYVDKLPQDIYIFGINAISPQNLKFIFELSKYINIHILYIDPCKEFWFDLNKDKVSNWLGNEDFEQQPLLANLGQQGKEFFNQILENDKKHEITVFEDFKLHLSSESKSSQQTNSMLQSVQRNLLLLDTAKYHHKDNSISINSCHSSMREVQVLHDNLLDMFADDENLKPKDILVMCPNIEDYAPYIDSIFTPEYFIKDDNKIPCSIADRTLKDSDSLITSFLDILELPDSNFEVTKILDFLSVPAIQRKFNIDKQKLETIIYWLRESCIHRELGDSGKTYSWQWGLNKLLLGFCISDSNEIINQDTLMTMPNINGKEIIELGVVYELLEILQKFSYELKEPKTILEWQTNLQQNIELIFEMNSDDELAKKNIHKVISKFVEDTKNANLDNTHKIDLSVMRYSLRCAFSQPEINNHFLTGKVTFCSMTPMRCIPFKVIAMLGLNSGQFPRVDTPLSFDIMSKTPRQKGDTTAKDNDRYLFLETLVSARKRLYLSYIGKSVRNNAEQEASLILKELISYLKVYDFDDKQDIFQYPLHPFSQKCYNNDNYRSYDKHWLNLIGQEAALFSDKIASTNDKKLSKNISVNELVKIFDDPLKAYAQASLKLYFDNDEEQISDSEPFDVPNLIKHQLKRDTFQVLLDDKNIDEIKTYNKLTGKLPISPLSDETIDEESQSIADFIAKYNLDKCKSKSLNIEISEHSLSTVVKVDNENNLIISSISHPKKKDKLELYLNTLMMIVNDEESLQSEFIYLKDKNKEGQIINIEMSKDDAQTELTCYLQQANKLLNTPYLSHIDLADIVYTEKDIEVKWSKAISVSKYNLLALESNEYFNLFYPDSATSEKFDDLDGLYSRLYEEFKK